MIDTKHIGLDVHQATISVAVLDCGGRLVMEAVLETKAELSDSGILGGPHTGVSLIHLLSDDQNRERAGDGPRSRLRVFRRRRGRGTDVGHGQIDGAGLVIERHGSSPRQRRHILDQRVLVRRILMNDRECALPATRGDVDQSLRWVELQRVHAGANGLCRHDSPVHGIDHGQDAWRRSLARSGHTAAAAHEDAIVERRPCPCCWAGRK